MKKGHMEIILEDMRGKLDLVLEAHDALRHQIDDTRLELGERIELNSFRIDGLNKKVDGVELSLSKKIDDVESRLNKKIDGVESGLNKRIDSLDSKIDKVDTSLSAKIDGVESGLNKKIVAFESNLGKKIDAVAVDLAAHRADTESHGKGYRVSEE